MAFSEEDRDGNQQLDFEEFLALMPSRIREQHTAAEIRAIFDAADPNGDGFLSTNEFFVWTLSISAREFGCAPLKTAFEFYDTDKTGCLTATEFSHAANDMGFAAVAHGIFRALDVDHSGTLSYSELERSLLKAPPADASAKKMLVTLSWTSDASLRRRAAADPAKTESPTLTALRPGATIDTSGWIIRGRDPISVRRELQTLLVESGGHVADIIKLFDQDQDFSRRVDDMEFLHAMKTHFGYKGPPNVINEVFNWLDVDGSGYVGFDELFEFVRGRVAELGSNVALVALNCPDGAILAAVEPACLPVPACASATRSTSGTSGRIT